jgi:hypothetical protein
MSTSATAGDGLHDPPETHPHCAGLDGDVHSCPQRQDQESVWSVPPIHRRLVVAPHQAHASAGVVSVRPWVVEPSRSTSGRSSARIPVGCSYPLSMYAAAGLPPLDRAQLPRAASRRGMITTKSPVPPCSRSVPEVVVPCVAVGGDTGGLGQPGAGGDPDRPGMDERQAHVRPGGDHLGVWPLPGCAPVADPVHGVPLDRAAPLLPELFGDAIGTLRTGPVERHC